MNIYELRKLDKELINRRNEYIDFNPKDYEASSLGITIGFLCGLFLIFMSLCSASIIPFIIALFCFTCPYQSYNSTQKELNDLKNNIFFHNNNYNLNQKFIEKYGMYNKELFTRSTKFSIEKIFIYDEQKKFYYVRLFWNKKYHIETPTIIFCDFSDILRYEFVDKTSSKTTATSTTESNSGKALGGALLLGETGAIIGAAGERRTETEYKTEYKYSYDINIFLNRLNDAIIKVNTNSRNIASEIISVLEYILKQNIHNIN